MMGGRRAAQCAGLNEDAAEVRKFPGQTACRLVVILGEKAKEKAFVRFLVAKRAETGCINSKWPLKMVHKGGTHGSDTWL